MSQIPPFRRLFAASVALLAIVALSWPAPTRGQEAQGDLMQHTRVPVPSLSGGEDHPFTIEIPVTWQVRRDLPAPGVFLGPPGGSPESHPEMVLVHESDVSVEEPTSVLANLQANAEQSDWSILEAEVRDFGGVEGLWIVRKMPPAGLHGERVNVAVKLPLGEKSLDLLATVPMTEYEALSAQLERMLHSVRPAGAEG